MAQDLLVFNGINGSTGEYGLPPMSSEELSRRLQGLGGPENLAELRFRVGQRDQAHFGVKEGVDPKKLDQAGWGIVFSHDADPGVREALAPLIALRRNQAGERFRLYEGTQGLRPGESKSQFLARNGAGPGPADPAKVPYYLLLVGGPEAISYRFQSQLDVQYAVGRIAFDRREDYAQYAASVVTAEKGLYRRARGVSLFGAHHPDDRATLLSEKGLVTPLADYLRSGRRDWKIETLLREGAGKASLLRLLGGRDARPSLLFAACHGMEFPRGDARQQPHQGALLCGDWPGPKNWSGPIPQDFYLAADDLGADDDLGGLIAFFFACYGLGTPHLDDFAKQAFQNERAEIAPHSFLAALPQRMLCHPKGGALAVIGHVERAWGYSFAWPGAGTQTAVFESTLDRLLDGHPIGSALEYFNERYAELSTVLSDQLEEIEFGAAVDPYELAGLWTANNDARGYQLLGDPAVRMVTAIEATREHERGEALGVDIGEGPRSINAVVLEESSTRNWGRTSDLNDLLSYRPPPGGAPTEKGPYRAEAAARVERDDLRFSAYHPRALDVGVARPVLVYAHLEAALREVEGDASRRLGLEAQDFKRREASATTGVQAGTTLLLVPQGEGLRFEPPEARLLWQPPMQQVEFEVVADASRAGHVVQSSVACYVGPLLIAEIRLPLVVQDPGDATPAGDEPEKASAKVYQRIFASYSHADTQVVAAMEKAYQALGMDYLRDVMTLKSGQEWSQQLLQMIDEADIFQLFWSHSASESVYVEQEWRRALQIKDHKGGAFIRPMWWQKPMPKVPRELSRLHFAPVEISPLGALIPVAPEVVAASPSEEDETFSVKTYSCADPADPRSKKLLAITHIHRGGDIETYFADDAGDAVLALHENALGKALRR